MTIRMAEGLGFEPRDACTSAVFKTAAFDRSAIPPELRYYLAIGELRILMVDSEPTESRLTRRRTRPQTCSIARSIAPHRRTLPRVVLGHATPI